MNNAEVTLRVGYYDKKVPFQDFSLWPYEVMAGDGKLKVVMTRSVDDYKGNRPGWVAVFLNGSQMGMTQVEGYTDLRKMRKSKTAGTYTLDIDINWKGC